jgi:hypothetical protein
MIFSCKSYSLPFTIYKLLYLSLTWLIPPRLLQMMNFLYSTSYIRESIFTMDGTTLYSLSF